MPPRNTLYATSPIGRSTPLVESLTSYLTRLAQAHCVFPGVLLSKMIAPLVPGSSPWSNRYGLFADAGGRSMLLNGTGLPALSAVQALEALTKLTDLRYLTCLPLAPILSTRAKGLLHERKVWCPACYAQWREAGQEIYDPLLWAFAEITHCVRHQQPLIGTCPYPDCARSLPGIAWRSRVGYCSYCQRWLGTPSASTPGTRLQEGGDWQWQQWLTEAVGTVLASLPRHPSFLQREHIGRVVQYAVASISAGEPSEISAFARAVKMPRNMIDHWYQGRKVPAFRMLLQLCFRLQLSLSDVLFQEIDMLHPCLRDPASLSVIALRKKSLVREEEVAQRLENIVASQEQPPPSLQQIMRRLGHTASILYRCHPSACSELVRRYKASIQQQKEARLQRFQEEIQQIILRLHSQGLPLTQKQISFSLTQPGILRDPRLRAFLSHACREITEEI